MNAEIDEIILLAGGTVLIGLGLGRIAQVRKLYKTGVRAKGEVVAIEEVIDHFARNKYNGNNVLYYPLIKYMASDNEWMTVKYETGANPSAYKEGDVVNIIYNKADYRQVIIDNFFNRISGFLIMILGICLIVGVVIYYLLNQY